MCHNYIGSDTHAHVFPHDGWSFHINFFFSFYIQCVATRFTLHALFSVLFCLAKTKMRRSLVVQHECGGARDGTAFQVPLVTCRFTGIVLSVHRCCYCWRFFPLSSPGTHLSALIQTRHSATLSRCNRITLETMQGKYHKFRWAEEENEKWKKKKKTKMSSSNWWTSARLALALL